MGTRFKTFESTGLAPNGRLYAGDLNQMQDVYADQSNYAQQVDLNALSIGESALKLLRYGAGEARISGALRIDGIFRGLGGIYAGAFTTAQRNAIASGLRPYGLIILNTDAAAAGRLEWNAGTDAVPNWQPVSDVAGVVPVGTTIDWPWIHTQLPANYLLCYGQAVPRATYPILHAIASASAYPHGNGDGSTTFNLPDHRGRVAIGRDDMGGAAAGRITSGGSGIPAATLGATGGVQNVGLVSGEMPAHVHTLVAATITGAPTVTGTPALTGVPGLSGTPGISGSVSNGTLTATIGSLVLPNHGHVHNLTLPDHAHNFASYDSIIKPGSAHAPVGSGGGNGSDDAAPVIGGVSSFPGINGSVNGVSSSPAIGGVPGLSGSISNGTLAITIGSLLGTIGTLQATIGSLGATAGSLDVGGSTDSNGSGTAHQNVQPSIVVNKAMRVA